MPSYMTIIVLALATSNVSAALSVPDHSSRKVREQSLSRREDPPESSRPLLPGNSVQPANPPTDSEPPKKAVGTGLNAKLLAINFVMGITTSLFAASIFEDMTGSYKSAPATSSTTSSSSTSSANQNAQYNSGSTSTAQSGQTQYGNGQYPNQQHAVDHGKRADDFFGPSEAKARSISDNKRRATSHLELSSRADLGEAFKLFRRVLDELD